MTLGFTSFILDIPPAEDELRHIAVGVRTGPRPTAELTRLLQDRVRPALRHAHPQETAPS